MPGRQAPADAAATRSRLPAASAPVAALGNLCDNAGLFPQPEPAVADLAGLVNLLAPFFGLIVLGFFCGTAQLPASGLAWMQFFLIYVALPCLFYRLIADKPLTELANWPFIAATTRRPSWPSRSPSRSDSGTRTATCPRP